MSVNLYDALKSSYGDEDAEDELVKQGYEYDRYLSNDNQQVWYNPTKNHLLYNVAGTHNISDIIPDIYLAFGNLKATSRYKEAKNTLEQAKEKYKLDRTPDTTITGQSLGGAIAQYVGSKDDKIFTLNKGATIGQKTRKNEKAYRVEGDIVSLANAYSKRMKTLKNNNLTRFIPVIGNYDAHAVDTIKNRKLFIN
jgi:hypothetical protein